MVGGRAVGAEQGDCIRSVAFILVKIVGGELVVEVDHDVVAGDFGEDGGGGDRGIAGVAFDNGFGGAGEVFGELVAVNEGLSGVDLAEAMAHCFKGGPEDIFLVDDLDGDNFDVVDCAFDDASEGGFTLGFGQGF